tara:strand:- start:5716 stop:7170 length:1455 start_codon:yes stop_codon:yes gene_type:complete
MKKYKYAILSIFISGNLAAADWVSDWVNQSGVGSGASTYKGGNRTYMSAGNLSLRSNGTTDYPFTISAPRIETSGCGIDIFGGGISYMDSEFLVQKFEGIIQNAEVVAFQLGVQALSDKLGSIITDMEDITNFINSMQLNDCAIAKSAVTTIVDGGNMSDAGNAVWKEISQGQTLDLGIFKNPTDSTESVQSHDGLMDTSVNIYQEIASCPEPVKNLFDTGSVIEHLTSMYGMGSYEDFIRGYIGDVFIMTPSGTNIPIGITKGSCPQNAPEDIEDFVHGTSFKGAEPTPANPTKPLVCTAQSGLSLISYSEDKLNDLADKIKDRTSTIASDASLLNFVNNAPLPVYSLVRNAVAKGMEVPVIDDLKVTLAYAYSYHIFTDLYRNVENIMIKAEEAKSTASGDDAERAAALAANPTGSTPKCNLKAFVVIDSQIVALRDRLKEIKSNSKKSYQNLLYETTLLNENIQRMNDSQKIKRAIHLASD